MRELRMEERIAEIMSTGMTVCEVESDADAVFKEASRRHPDCIWHKYHAPALHGWAVAMLASKDA